jgi:fatty acid desaturase
MKIAAPTPNIKPHGEYVKEVKQLLPKKAFAPAPAKLIFVFCYLVILFFCYRLFAYTQHILCYILLTLACTHCLSSIAFLAHELSHNSIVKSKPVRYVLELLTWGINLIPPTMWDRVHNHTHHTQINTPLDPDRFYFESEKSTSTRIYSKIFYPSKKSLKWNPVVLFHFIPYIARNIFSVFYRNDAKPAIVPFKPGYTISQKKRIAFELLIILFLQVAIFCLVGKNWIAFLFASPVNYLLSSAILNTYIYTNHFLNEVSEESDPVLGTTSVKVPGFLNKLHFNFSYHTEHHLFPSMNSDYFPELSKILQERYPDRYNQLDIIEAWKKLWKSDEFLKG